MFSGALRPTAAFATALALVTLAACSARRHTPGGSTNPTSAGTSAGTSAASTTFPVTIEHVFGGRSSKKQPTRVAAISWANQDAAIALGVVPAAMPFASYGGDADGYLPWTRPALEALGGEAPALLDEADGLDFEGITTAAPDLILGTYSRDHAGGLRQALQGRPTVMYLVAVGRAVRPAHHHGRQGPRQGDRGRAGDQGRRGEARERARRRPELEGKTFAYLWFNSADPSSVTYYDLDARVAFVESLGLKSAPKIAELSTSNDEFFGTTPPSSSTRSTRTSCSLTSTARSISTPSRRTSSSARSRRSRPEPSSRSTTRRSSCRRPAPSPLSVPWAVDQYVPRDQGSAREREVTHHR